VGFSELGEVGETDGLNEEVLIAVDGVLDADDLVEDVSCTRIAPTTPPFGRAALSLDLR